MGSFQGDHPDWLDSVANPNKVEVAGGIITVHAGVFADVPMTLGRTSGILLLDVAGCELVESRVFFDMVLTTSLLRNMAGDLSTIKRTWLAIPYPPGALATARVWNLSNADENVTVAGWVYLNGYLAMLESQSLELTDDNVTVHAGNTTTVARLDSVGNFDRVAGCCVSSQPSTVSIEWGVLHTPAAPPSVMVTMSQTLGAVGANVPLFFDVPVVAPCGVLQVQNTGMSDISPRVSIRQYRQRN